MTRQKTITITESQKRQLVLHSEDASPNEGCALLFGAQSESNVTISDIFFTKNTDESPVNFTISNEELLKGYDIAKQKNLDLVGIFHSHPDSDAVPSETDRKFMLANPVVWVIYSGKNRDFGAYVLESEVTGVQIIS